MCVAQSVKFRPSAGGGGLSNSWPMLMLVRGWNPGLEARPAAGPVSESIAATKQGPETESLEGRSWGRGWEGMLAGLATICPEARSDVESSAYDLDPVSERGVLGRSYRSVLSWLSLLKEEEGSGALRWSIEMLCAAGKECRACGVGGEGKDVSSSPESSAIADDKRISDVGGREQKRLSMWGLLIAGIKLPSGSL